MVGRQPLKYRNAVAADVEQIASLHADSWRRNYRGFMRDEFLDGEVVQNRRSTWKQRLTSPPNNQFVLVAEEVHVVRGFVCAFGDDDPTWGSLVDNLHVAHAVKRQGIGRRLMRATGIWAKHNYPHCWLYLWVAEANHPARQFYERLGATNEGLEVTKLADGGFGNSLRYVWKTLAPLTAGSYEDERE